MNFAVTGGAGFFGLALVRALVERGDRVCALVRRDEAAEQMRSLGAEPLMGDLTVPGACDELAAEGDIVIHSAARVDLTGRLEQFQQTTVEGTRKLLASVAPRGLARFVYVSSEAVYAPEAGVGGFCADRTPTRPAADNYYGRAKLAAERLVRAECERAGLPWTIVRLGVIYGPGNTAVLKHFIPVAENGKLFIVGDGENRIATVYVDDAAHATILAATSPKAENRIYDIASDERVTQRQFVNATCDALGIPGPRGRINRRVALTAAWLVERIGEWTRHEVHISRSSVALMSADQVIDASRIRDELGWAPEIEFSAGMLRMRDWRRQMPTEAQASGKAKTAAPTPRFSQ